MIEGLHDFLSIEYYTMKCICSNITKYAFVSWYLSFNCSIVVVVYKKRKASKEPEASHNYTDMDVRYEARAESVKATRKPHSQPTSPSHQHFVKPPITAVKPNKDIELKESEELADNTYESV